MRYFDGMLIGAAAIMAVIVSVAMDIEFTQCLSIAVCAGVALDFVARRVFKQLKNEK